MKKIPTIFDRDWDGDRSRVLDAPHPDCAWVFAGEGAALQKLDGTSCKIESGKLFKRREIREGKPEPDDFVCESHDGITGKKVGWIPVGDGDEDKWHRQAFDGKGPFEDGTYELVGPKVQGNPEQYGEHTLVAHKSCLEMDAPTEFGQLKAWLEGRDIEGLVWHHPDGRMAKIKLRDFGFKR